jgi:predicted O-linked N-acetylglucosamine transferase (SPINDLY family)
VATPDTVTARLESAFEHWRNVHGLDDETLAAQIRRDRIDVLVDLTMHMAQGRPLLFARKPAPVQACWLAYPGTTGVAAIDARLSDPHLDPPGSDTSVHTEKTVCLADTFWCYDPQVGDVEVGPLPARARGGITFGCLNNPMKLNPDVLSLWGRVLREVAGSRLVVLAAPGSVARRIVDAIAAQGVDRDRVEIVKRRARPEYMTLYRDIDICLDTFPYGGHTTSLDAFWMGVPVVTLVGDRVVGRAGLSQATNLGMTDLVARTPDEYVDVARRWATDLERLEATRHGLRAKMQGSPLMDGARFARALEAAYRELWVGWCAERSVARRGR